MPKLNNVELHWVKVDPKNPTYFQNDRKNPGMWSVQLRTKTKKEADSWKNEYGFKVTPEEGSDGKLYYKTTLTTYAFDKDGELNKPVALIAANGDALDPREVGNGSIGNVLFSYNPEKKIRRLKGIQVKKLLRYIPTEQEGFDLSDDFVVVEPESDENDEDDIPF